MGFDGMATTPRGQLEKALSLSRQWETRILILTLHSILPIFLTSRHSSDTFSHRVTSHGFSLSTSSFHRPGRVLRISCYAYWCALTGDVASGEEASRPAMKLVDGEAGARELLRIP